MKFEITEKELRKILSENSKNGRTGHSPLADKLVQSLKQRELSKSIDILEEKVKNYIISEINDAVKLKGNTIRPDTVADNVFTLLYREYKLVPR